MVETRAGIDEILLRTISSTYLCVRNVLGKWKQTVNGQLGGGSENFTTALVIPPLLIPNIRIPLIAGVMTSEHLQSQIKLQSFCQAIINSKNKW